MSPDARVVLLEERRDGTWLIPSAPLGRWVMRPLGKLMRAMEPGASVTLDLSHAPVTKPRHVAAILWAQREAKLHGLELTISTPDMISSELLAFSGLETAVRSAPPAMGESPARL